MIKTAIVEDEAAAAAHLADCLKRYGEENGVVFSCDVYDGSVRSSKVTTAGTTWCSWT